MNIRGFKFLVEVTILNVCINVKFQCKLQVIVKRGSQKLETQPTNSLENGIAQINETLTFNMSANLSEGRFEEKKTHFCVILVTDKGNKNAGSMNLDMSQYLNAQKFGIQYVDVEFQEDLPLEKCPDKSAKIRASFKISQIGQLENEPFSADQSLDLSQVSILTPGRESLSNKQPLLSEKKLNESKSQLFETTEKKAQDINELLSQNQNLKLQISEMIDKEYFQQIVSQYEQQLADLQNSYKQVYNENQTISNKFKAQVNIMSKQADDLLTLQNKIKEYETEKQENKQNQTENQLEQRDLKISDLEERLKQITLDLEEKNQQFELKQSQYNEKLEQIQNLKNLTSGTISALSQRNELLEKRLNEQKEAVEKLKEQNNILETSHSNLQQKYDTEIARKEDQVQNLQQKLEDSQKLDTSKSSVDSKTQKLEQQVEVQTVRQDKSLAEQQLARLRSQVQGWQSKWESNQKVLNDYTNEVQQMSRQVADTPSFIEDQRELPEQLQLLKRAIQRKLQSYQVAQQHLEQEVQRLEQELEVCQYKLKLEQSQQCSDSQFQEKMQNYSQDQLNSVLEQKNQECQNLQQQIDQFKQSEVEQQKLYDEAKTQLTNLRTLYSKTKQQLTEQMSSSAMAAVKTKELERALKEKSQEIQKNADLINELEQYNIQMEEGLSGMLDQYKIQNQQIKQTYEKEKAQKQELQKQIKVLKEQLATQQKGMETQASKVQEAPVCNCKEKIQNYEQQIAELQYQITQMQIQLYENTVQRNSIAQIRTSVLMSRRESLFRESVALVQQEEVKKEELKHGATPETGKVKELEEKVVNLQDERIKLSKEYQTVLERALLSNSQLEQKYSQQIQQLNTLIENQYQELVVIKLKIGDIFNAAIEVGGTKLVDKLQIALGLKE